MLKLSKKLFIFALSMNMNSQHAATRRGKAEMQYFLLEKDDKQ